jgi:hypothetical protein
VFLMKRARQCCQVDERTLETAALIPSCASETTSLTPPKPLRASSRENSFPIGSASDAPISSPSTSRRMAMLTPTAMRTATETMSSPRRT